MPALFSSISVFCVHVCECVWAFIVNKQKHLPDQGDKTQFIEVYKTLETSLWCRLNG